MQDLKKWRDLFFKRSLSFLKDHSDWMFSIFNVGFLAFIILFTAFGRDYSFMKIIYLFPGVLAALVPLLKGFDFVFHHLKKSKIWFSIFQTSIVILLIFYIIPILNLITKLVNT